MKANLFLDKNFIIGKADKRLFGVFVEPIGNIVYGNLYNPEHPLADEDGFRTDILDLMRDLGCTVIRYPGGNFISGYHWEDGIGPREDRPLRHERAWGAIETNAMGIDEYTLWVKKIGAQPMLAVNLGTGTPEEAANEIEYTNWASGTYYSNQRRKNGYEEPHNIKMWCLGNEMDGKWQLGEKTAEEYGRIAYETAKQMRLVDSEVELIACGSCANDVTHPTFPEWDRVVLEHCYDEIDYLSLHRYYNYDPESVKGTAFHSEFTVEDLPQIAKDLSLFIDTVCAAADYVKMIKRSEKTIHICFDEWGIISSRTAWAEGVNWTERPAPPASRDERSTNLIDAVLYGSLLITFLNKCDRVKLACQSIVIGGMIASDPSGGSFRQSTFYPFQHVAKYADGTVLRPALTGDMMETRAFGEQHPVQCAAVYNQDRSKLTVFAVNLDIRNTADFVANFEGAKLSSHIQLYDQEALAVNSFENPQRLVPKSIPVIKDSPVIPLPPLSWNVLEYEIDDTKEGV